jgi:hypothetical protein
MKVSRHNQRCGAALMLSLWALFLLSAMVIAWALEIDSRLILSGQANRNLEAEALACSGAEVAMHPRTSPDTPGLTGDFGRDQHYEARITGEGGRINLNWVAAQPENPARIELLRKYLEVKGVELNDRDRMIDTLLDWIDPDNLVRLNGAEDEEGYKAANKPLTSLEEVKKIKGWEEFTSAKDWDADLTLDSGQNRLTGGPIDIEWASRDVLLALPGASEDRVDQYITMRSGGDGIDGTSDDPFRQNAQNGQPGAFDQAQALNILGLNLQQDPQLASLIGSDQMRRVISVGKSGDVTRTVRVVFQKGGQIKSWKEY